MPSSASPGSTTIVETGSHIMMGVSLAGDSTWTPSTTKPPEGGLLIEHHVRQPRASGDAELMFLRGPAVRERAGKPGDGEVGMCAAVGNGLDDTRRHEGEWGEVADVALDLVLASGNLLELSSRARHIARCSAAISLVYRDEPPRGCDRSRDLERCVIAALRDPGETRATIPVAF